jgi:hypothetical protein
MLARVLFTALGVALLIAVLAFAMTYIRSLSSATHTMDMRLHMTDDLIELRYGEGIVSLTGLPFLVAAVICLVGTIAFGERIRESNASLLQLMIGAFAVLSIAVLATYLAYWGVYILVCRRGVTIDVQQRQVKRWSRCVIPISTTVHRLDQYEKVAVIRETYSGARWATYTVYAVVLEGPTATLDVDRSSFTVHDSAKWLAEQISAKSGLVLDDRDSSEK